MLCTEGPLTARHLPGTLTRRSILCREQPNPGDPLKEAEIKIITDALQKNNYNRAATAKMLGIHKSTLFRKIGRLGISLPKTDGRCKNRILSE